MTPPAQTPAISRTESGDPEEVLKLTCPECGGTLNLRRKHIGLAGKCVHCEFPVTAVEEAGSVTLVSTEQLKAAKSEPVVKQEPMVQEEPVQKEEPMEEAKVAPMNDMADTWTSPAAAEPAVAEEAPSSDDSSSPWGVPPKNEEDSSEEPPAEEGFNMPASFDVPANEPTAESPAFDSLPQMEPKVETEQEMAPELSSPVSEEPSASPSSEEGPDSGSPLFGNPSSAGGKSAMFAEAPQAADLNEGWGAKPPTETHASISPFATGSANEEQSSNSMGNSLFGESAAHTFGDFDAKSPFGDQSGPIQTGSPLFAKSDEENENSDEEVVLDGDGRPLRPMTEEEKEQFGQDMMKFGGYHKRSPWRKRILKFLITIVVLCGLGYAGYYFMPDDMAETVKGKVIEFLEPGSVLADFLPFEVGTDPETGEEGQVRIKAIDGLNQLTDEFDAYLDQAEENLNETMGEGHKLPEREEKEKMDTPAMPKLPFSLPGMGGGAAEKTSEGSE